MDASHQENQNLHFNNRRDRSSKNSESILSTYNIAELLKTREALNQSQELLSQLMENLPVLFWLRNLDGRLLYANSMWEQFLEKKPSIGQHYSQLFNSIHEDDREYIEKQAQLHTKGGMDSIVRMKNLKGETEWFHIRTFPVNDQKGHIYRVAGIGENITAQKQKEIELSESRETFNQFMNNAPLGIIMKNENFRMTFMNPMGETLSRSIFNSDWNGKTVFEIFPREIAEKIHENEIEILNEKKTSTTNQEIKTSEGTKYFKVIRFPIHLTSSKKILGGFIMDQTESVNLENSLRASESMLKEAQRISRLGSWELNLETNGLKWSDEIFQIFEINPEKFGASYEAFLNAIHPEDRDLVNSAYGNSVTEKTAYEIKHRLLMSDGRIKYVNEQGRTFYDENGKPIRSIGTVQDITEQVIAENKVKASLHEKEILLKEIHHRVKNNLQIISSLLQLQSMNLDESLKDIFRVSQNRITSMALIHEKLYQTNDLSHIPIKNYMHDVAHSLLSTYGFENGVQIISDGEEIYLNIVSAVPCGLIINEIITNSLKHAFPGKKGNIFLSLKSKDGMYHLEAGDDGVGLPEDFLSRKKTSLGMKLIENLTLQLNGKLEILSENQKTIFHITFPAAADSNIKPEKDAYV